MKARCNNHKNISYKRYWAKWITYDTKRETFEWFQEDMKDWYKENLTLDRIDNNKWYHKENCRWSTYKQQANNKECNIVVEYMGKKQTVSMRCNELWLPVRRTYRRLEDWWSVKRAFEECKNTAKKIQYNWEELTIRELSKRIWIKAKTIYWRLQNNPETLLYALQWKPKWWKNKLSKTVEQYTKDWEFIKKWSSMSEASRKLKISVSNISRACMWKIKSAWWYKRKYKK